jgi:hypothetical protein
MAPNEKFMVEKTITKTREKAIMKTKKRRVRLPDDTVLDMFRFFTRRELCSFKLVTRRMKRVVELGDHKKQLRQRFVLRKILFSVCFIFCILYLRAADIKVSSRWIQRNAGACFR